ncbi:MAG: hypothetical protein EA364_14530 [Balneolaceae bacterium]|nr:MAG: hypothetical protein EA364_14530 [Balneolaceae bacterium]
MDRKTFIIGAGGLLTWPLWNKIELFTAQYTKPLLPFDGPPDTVIWFDPDSLTLLSDIPVDGIEVVTDYTWEYYITEYNLETWENRREMLEILEAYGITEKQLDDVIDADLLYEHAVEQFCMHDSPTAGVFFMLQDLDLGPALTGQKNSRGEICFHDGDTPGSSFRGVTVRDLNSVSLLQVRLNELETGWQIMELPADGKSRSEIVEITM